MHQRSGATRHFRDVAPETRTYEIGGKADLFHRRLQLTAALFRNERTNFRVARVIRSSRSTRF
jgi:catecholate siderophore receptor